MKSTRRIIANILYIALGAALFGLSFTAIVDPFWSGMGGALISVGVVRTLHILHYSKDESYREKKEIEASDERSQFIRIKAWAWAGYLFVLISAVSTIVFKLLGQELLSMASGFAICILLVLHWCCRLALNQKY